MIDFNKNVIITSVKTKYIGSSNGEKIKSLETWFSITENISILDKSTVSLKKTNIKDNPISSRIELRKITRKNIINR